MYVDASTISAFPAAAFRVCDGVAMGDALGGPDAIIMDDIYQLEYDATAENVHLMKDLCSLARLTFMTPQGKKVEAIIVSDGQGTQPDQFIVPLKQIEPSQKYRLIACDTSAAMLQMPFAASDAGLPRTKFEQSQISL